MTLAFRKLHPRFVAEVGPIELPSVHDADTLAEISNLDPEGRLMKPDDRRREYNLGNRLWHTDASFKDPAGRDSMLHAKVVRPVPADTEFADIRASGRSARRAERCGGSMGEVFDNFLHGST